MTIKEILKGLEFRLKGLEESYYVISAEEGMEYTQIDYEARIDELDSLYLWIKTKSELEE